MSKFETSEERSHSNPSRRESNADKTSHGPNGATAGLSKRRAKSEPAFEVISKAERYLNRVLAYQAAIAVHQLQEDLGLDVEELALSVAPLSAESPGIYRVTCTIARASSPEPVVINVVVEPEKSVANR